MHGRHRAGEDPFRLLFVCPGNICRSPYAEIYTPLLLTGRLVGRTTANWSKPGITGLWQVGGRSDRTVADRFRRIGIDYR